MFKVTMDNFKKLNKLLRLLIRTCLPERLLIKQLGFVLYTAIFQTPVQLEQRLNVAETRFSPVIIRYKLLVVRNS